MNKEAVLEIRQFLKHWDKIRGETNNAVRPENQSDVQRGVMIGEHIILTDLKGFISAKAIKKRKEDKRTNKSRKIL